MSMHLFACFMPLVFTLLMPRKFTSVPNTGSTVALLSFFIRFALGVCNLACMRSYSGLSTESSIFLKLLLPIHLLLKGQCPQSLELLFCTLSFDNQDCW